MLRKIEILRAAEEAGFGVAGELGQKFDSWQRFGLVGKMTAKEPRRGGAGLWHPVQADLFVAALSNRSRRIHLTTVANIPVGLWMLGTEGVEIEQAQRALFYWATRRALGTHFDEKRGTRPTGQQSMRQRVVEAVVESVSDPDAAYAPKRALREQLRNQADGLAASSGAVPTSFIEAYLAVVSPGRASTLEQREAGAELYHWIRFQILAAPYLIVLCAGRKDVRDFWMWLRRYGLNDLEPGPPAPPPDLARAVVGLTPDQGLVLRGLERSCAMVMSYAGVGLRILAGADWPDRLVRPPSIRGVRLDPLLAETDELVTFIERDRLASLPSRKVVGPKGE